MYYNFHELGIDTHGRTDGKIKTFCPKCRENRHNKADKSLSVDLGTGLYLCHYCNWSGKADDGSSRQRRKMGDSLAEWKQPSWPQQHARKAQQSSQQLAQSPPSLPSLQLQSPFQSPPSQHPTPPRPQPSFSEETTPLSAAQLTWLTDVRHLSVEAIDALGLTSALHFMPQTGQKEQCICFNYRADGQLVNIKYRAQPKLFALITGTELIPYHIDGIRGMPEAIIVEGELDAAAFITAGRTDVVSVPGGANRNLTWMDRFMETHFEDKRVVYLAVDTDTKGNELRDELLRRLGAERCRLVTYGDGCKDANELLVKSGPQALLQALEEAPEIPLEGVFTAADVAEEMRALFKNGLSRGAETGLKNLDNLCTFETGRLCVITGNPGEGKSEFADELVLRLSLYHGWRAAYFSPENLPLEYHLSKLTEKLTGGHFKEGFLSEHLYEASQRYLQENISSILPEANFNVETILERARCLVVRRGIRTLIIDPFNKLEHLIPPGQTETQYISSFLDLLTNFARRNRCLVILVAHPRKMQRDPHTGNFPVPTLQDINGSAAFVNKCDFGLIVERDYQAGVTRVHVRKVKFRHLGNIGVCSFIFNLVNGRFSPCTEDPTAERPEARVTNTLFDNKSWVGRQEDEARQGEMAF